VTLSVVANGATPLTYQWRLGDNIIPGAESSSLTISNVQFSDAGTYSVQISNAFNVVVSSNAVLTVIKPADFDLSRDFSNTANPNGAWTFGYKNTLSGELVPFGLFAQSYDDGGALQDVWLRILGTPSAVFHNGSAKTGSSESGAGNYPPGTVMFFPGYEGNVDNYGAIRFTAPESGTYNVGSAVHSYLDGPISGDTDFHVVANGAELLGQFLPGNGGTTYSNDIVLAEGDSIDFLVGRGQDNRLYASGLKINIAINLVSRNPVAPSIVTQPHAQTVAPGSTVTFTVVAKGTAPLSYQWFKGENEIPGATSSSLVLVNVQQSDAGAYKVKVSNTIDNLFSDAAALVVDEGAVAPSVVTLTPSLTTTVGSPITLSVVAAGSAPLSYQWRFNGTAIPNETNATYSIASAQVSDTGPYRVYISNGSGNILSDPVDVSVVATATPPVITTQPTAGSALAGSTVSLSVQASGTAPLSYQWRFNGTPLNGETGSSLVLPNIQPSQAGAYWVVVSSPYGTNTSSAASVNVYSGETGGTVNFANISTNYIYDVDGTTRLPAGTTYLAQLYAGATEGTLQPVGGAVAIRLAGKINGGIRTITAVSPGQAVWIQVRVWESAFGSTYEQSFAGGGKTGASVTFQVITGGGGTPPTIPANLVGLVSFSLIPPQSGALPIITAEPVDKSVSLGEGAAFSVTATGNFLSYQWKFNGTPIPSATSPTLTITNCQVANAGDYSVVVSNPAGPVPSDAAHLTVNIDQVLALIDPPNAHAGDLVSVPLVLTSGGDVGGLSFSIDFNPDYLSEAAIAWDGALDSSLKDANASISGQLHGVFILPATAVPAGTQQLAVITFRARTVPVDSATLLNLQVLDLSQDTGDPILYGTDVHSTSAHILASGAGDLTGDNNGNNRVDVGDASLLLRLLTHSDSTRPWDVTRNDLNHNSVLDSGDAIKILRIVAGIDAPPQQLLASPTVIKGSKTTSSSAITVNESASIGPDGLRGSAGQLVTVQVQLHNLSGPISGAKFTVNYPIQALRLRNQQALRLGSSVSPQALAVWNVAPSQNNFVTQNGHVTLALSSANPWALSNSVLAELTFEVQAGAAAQYQWPVTVTGTEITADGYSPRSLSDGQMAFIGRDQLPATFGGLVRQPSGQFQFNLSGDPGANYIVEVSDDLVTWTLVTNVSNSPASIPISDPQATGHQQRFYRARPAP